MRTSARSQQVSVAWRSRRLGVEVAVYANKLTLALWLVTSGALLSACGARTPSQLEPTRTLAPQPTGVTASATPAEPATAAAPEADSQPLSTRIPAAPLGPDVLGDARACADVRPTINAVAPNLGTQDGRVLYLTPESDIALSDISGKTHVRVTDDSFIDNDARRMRIYLFPTAASDGDAIAFVRLDVSGNSVTQTVTIAEPRDNGASIDVFSTGESTIPYVDWAPDGQTIAFLTINANSGEIRTAARTGGEASIIESGRPAYWHWHSDSGSLVTHLGGRGERRGEGAYLSTIDINAARRGDANVFDTLPGAFQSPHFSPAGSHMVYAANLEGAGDDALVLGDASGVPICVLSSVEHGAFFAWSPNGVHVAVMDTPGPAVAAGALRVIDVRDGSTQQVHQSAIAFFWSPDGDRLAVYSLSDSAAPTQIGQATGSARVARVSEQEGRVPMMRIEIASLRGGAHIPVVDTFMTGDFRQYLQFFDQYSRSVTPWSPNGTHLAFSGGQRTDAPPVFGIATFNPAKTEVTLSQLGQGSLAFFSPK